MSLSLSVVVCTYNRVQEIAQLFSSLAVQGLDGAAYEVLLVDNASEPEISASLRELAGSLPNSRYISEPEPGLSRARNTGLRAAHADIVAFVDDDATLHPSWGEAMLAAFEDPEVGAVGGRTLLAWPEARPSWLCRRFEEYYGTLDLGTSRRPLGCPDFPVGANMAFRKSKLEPVGLFSPELGRVANDLRSCEETELFLRLKDAGTCVMYEPGALAWHHVLAARVHPEYLRRRSRAQGRSDAFLKLLRGSNRKHRLALIGLATLSAGGKGHFIRNLRAGGMRRSIVSESVRIAYWLGFLAELRAVRESPAHV